MFGYSKIAACFLTKVLPNPCSESVLGKDITVWISHVAAIFFGAREKINFCSNKIVPVRQKYSQHTLRTQSPINQCFESIL